MENKRLVPNGSSLLEVDLVEEVAGVEQPGLVVDLVVQLQLDERAFEHLHRPTAHRTEDEVGGGAGRDEPGELAHADGVDGWSSQGGVDADGDHGGHHTTDDPAEDEHHEDRDEQQGGRHLDAIDAAGVHDRPRPRPAPPAP